jgi:SAM-dependent methyltransferase
MESYYADGTLGMGSLGQCSFDLVFSTLMMHHLPDDLKQQGLAEIARVLRPGGRVVIVDFAHGTGRRGTARTMGASNLGLEEQPALLTEAGFSQIESGKLAFPRLPVSVEQASPEGEEARQRPVRETLSMAD